MTAWPDFALPNDWQIVPIDDLALKLRAGGTPSRKESANWGGDIPFALIEDVTNSRFELFRTNELITETGLRTSSAWVVPAGTVLLTMYATIGATTVTKIPLATNQAIMAILPKECVDAEYLAFALFAHRHALIARNIEATQKNINKGIVSSFPLPLPPLPEQRKIAAVLSLVQRTIEQQEHLIALTTELRKALMHKLFTEGLHGEPQKETEIGPVPGSWTVVPLGSCLANTFKNGIYKHSKFYGTGTPIVRIDDFSNDGDIVRTAGQRVTLDEQELAQYRLGTNDILINRVNSLTHLGKTALVGQMDEDMVFESNMMRVRVDEEVMLPKYAYRLLNSHICKVQVLGAAKRAVAQASINQGDVKSLKVPVPCTHVQQKVADILDQVDELISIRHAKVKFLQELFRTLLHQLMTAQLRVNDLDRSVVENDNWGEA